MKIGIIGAMEEEVKALLKEMEVGEEKKKANMIFTTGKLFSKDVVVVTSGIGKVNAAVCTQILADDFNVDSVINVGIAGGVREDIHPGDVVVGESLVQHDVDTTFFGDKIGQIPRLETYDFKCDRKLVELAMNACEGIKEHKHFSGRIVSGDQFIADAEKMHWMNKEFDAYACEMEGASIAHVCHLNNIPCVVIRSISDNATNGSHMDYETFKDLAVENSTRIIRNMLKAM